MDYTTIIKGLREQGETKHYWFREYCRKHPVKARDMKDPSLFWFSLADQVTRFINGNPQRWKAPLTEKQARYAEKVVPGAYAFIQAERRKAGGFDNHLSKCPVMLGLNGQGLVAEDGMIICEGCNAILGKLIVKPEYKPEPVPVDLDSIELPETIDLDAEIEFYETGVTV